MSEDCDAHRNTSEEANGETVGVHFMDLVEIIDVSEEESQGSEKEKQDIIDGEELRRRLCEAETSWRERRELLDHMREDGLEVEKLINEMEAENKYLANKVKELQQQVANIRKRREGGDKDEREEALRQELLWEEERIFKSQGIYIRKMEKEIQKLKEKNEDLTAELDQLSLGEKYQEKIQNLRRAQQEFKDKLEEVLEELHSKDEEIEKKSTDLIKKNKDTEEHFNTMEDLRRDQRELREQLSSGQEELLVAESFQRESGNRQQWVSSWWCYAEGPWKGVKVAGAIALSVFLPVGIMATMAPACSSPDPDCNLLSIAFDLLEPYSHLHHTLPPVY